MLLPFQARLHPALTFQAAVSDKSYSLIDVQLIVEEAFVIDPRTCAAVIVLNFPSRDMVSFMRNPRAMREFLHVLDEEYPVLWLNAVSGVYRSRQVYDNLVM